MPLNSPLLGLFALRACLLLVIVGLQKRLILLLLSINALNGLFILSLLLRILLIWRICQFRQPYLGFRDIFREDIVNIVVLLLLLRLDLLLPARLEDLLELGLLLLAELVGVLEQLHQLLFRQLDVRAAVFVQVGGVLLPEAADANTATLFIHLVLM